jgi:hypothetical protein
MRDKDSISSDSHTQLFDRVMRDSFLDALRYWEPRRVVYNLILTAITGIWVAATWPHFRPMLTLHSLLLLTILAIIANVCYCAAYLVDILLQLSPVGAGWKRRRWVLWAMGTLVAIVAANYWIVDEIYPFVQ